MHDPGSQQPEGVAVVYCEGAFRSGYGKTAHGLVRHSRRYRVAAVVDSGCAGRDAGEVLDGGPSGIPVVTDLQQALRVSQEAGAPASHFVIGLAPDGGILDARARAAVLEALVAGLHVVSGLHHFLSQDPELARAAAAGGATLHDVRLPPDRSRLHFFSGKITQVDCRVVAVLGTDSAVGKRTTSWAIVQAFEAAGGRAELVGTGQTAWLQGARYSITLDSLVNDFVAGEIEHAVWSAWTHEDPDLIVVEGQGSLMHPAYPGGFEILAAARPDCVVVQHAPARHEYDGFPGYPLDPLATQIRAIELISSRPVVAVCLNTEGLDHDAERRARAQIEAEIGLPAWNVLTEGASELAALLRRQPRLGRGGAA